MGQALPEGLGSGFGGLRGGLAAAQTGAMEKGAWAELAVVGAEFACRVTPRARKPGISREGGVIKVAVSAPAEEGRANAAVAEALAHALGVAKTRLVLVRGATARDKLFRLD